MLREVADRDVMPGLKFKLVERGGTMVKWTLQNTNPTTMGGCASGDCQACKGGRGEEGHAENQMCCMSFPVSSVQLTGKLYILGKVQEIYTPGEENTLRTMQEGNKSLS